MKLIRLTITEETAEKLAVKHAVQRFEVREVFKSKPHIRFREKGHHEGEDVYAAYGQTYGGRYLVVFFIYKQDQSAFVLSARSMTPQERRLYERR